MKVKFAFLIIVLFLLVGGGYWVFVNREKHPQLASSPLPSVTGFLDGFGRLIKEGSSLNENLIEDWEYRYTGKVIQKDEGFIVLEPGGERYTFYYNQDTEFKIPTVAFEHLSTTKQRLVVDADTKQRLAFDTNKLFKDGKPEEIKVGDTVGITYERIGNKLWARTIFKSLRLEAKR